MSLKGFLVKRKAGWDTHGLPVELEVEKLLVLDGKEQIEEYEEKFSNPYRAAEMGYVDDVIEPATARKRVISAFDMLASKRQSLPAKKHGNIPL